MRDQAIDEDRASCTVSSALSDRPRRSRDGAQTFATVTCELDRIAGMGFDVVYLPSIRDGVKKISSLVNLELI